MTLIKWKEGAAVTVDFGQGFDGTVDQGHFATHHPGDSKSALLFELWDPPHVACNKDTLVCNHPFFDFYVDHPRTDSPEPEPEPEP